GADERLKRVLGENAADSTKINPFVTRATQLLNGASWNGDDLDYAAGYMISKYIFDNRDPGKNMSDLMTAIKDSTKAGNVAVEEEVAAFT
ncbi:hypothetical protein, partial [Pseudoalteromonas sp. SIMBA_162]|uniref:hypothetical protein n=1 Tax=Pseudoalteromonas sp. SIMBA_162 TaxID=3080867 RepID=UPI00397C1B30